MVPDLVSSVVQHNRDGLNGRIFVCTDVYAYEQEPPANQRNWVVIYVFPLFLLSVFNGKKLELACSSRRQTMA